MSGADARCARQEAIRSHARIATSSTRCEGSPNRIRSPYAEALKTHRVALAIAQSVVTSRPVTIEDRVAELVDA